MNNLGVGVYNIFEFVKLYGFIHVRIKKFCGILVNKVPTWKAQAVRDRVADHFRALVVHSTSVPGCQRKILFNVSLIFTSGPCSLWKVFPIQILTRWTNVALVELRGPFTDRVLGIIFTSTSTGLTNQWPLLAWSGIDQHSQLEHWLWRTEHPQSLCPFTLQPQISPVMNKHVKLQNLNISNAEWFI